MSTAAAPDLFFIFVTLKKTSFFFFFRQKPARKSLILQHAPPAKFSCESFRRENARFTTLSRLVGHDTHTRPGTSGYIEVHRDSSDRTFSDSDCKLFVLFFVIKTAILLNTEFYRSYNFDHFGRPKTPFPPCEWGKKWVSGGRY